MPNSLQHMRQVSSERLRKILKDKSTDDRQLSRKVKCMAYGILFERRKR
jgi:hypothetical protein